MVVTIMAAWFVGSQQKGRRDWGFWLFLLSNVLWVTWGWHDHAYALVILQVALATMNIRGTAKNQRAQVDSSVCPKSYVNPIQSRLFFKIFFLPSTSLLFNPHLQLEIDEQACSSIVGGDRILRHC